MPTKRYKPEQIVTLLRQIEVEIANGKTTPQAGPMITGSASPQKSRLRNPLLYSSLILVCVALYVVYVLLSRYESNRRYEEQTRQRQNEQRHEDDVRAVEQLGGSELAICGFYASPSTVRAGQSAQLCYDVANAKTVALDPPVASV
jgi:cytochrome c-type biogenesis protein CcmH/NrfG